jgi:23S rRNA (uracil1939-C5)-methyltransferase
MPNSNRVIPITECHLPENSINEFWPQLEFEPETNTDRVSLRLGADDDLMLVLESDSPEPPELEIEAGISVTHVYEEHTVIIAGSDHILMRVLERDFKVSAASFFQVNTVMAGKMVEHLLTCLPVSQSTTLLDVYCGVGLFSAFLAPKCKTVIGIESSESSCEDFAVNLDEFDNVELYEGNAEDVIPHLEANPDVVLVDPPRAGLDKAVVDGILKLSPSLLAYVSCDPSTLARDAARLINGGYKLKEVTPFDLFPQTYHIESISIFER